MWLALRFELSAFCSCTVSDAWCRCGLQRIQASNKTLINGLCKGMLCHNLVLLWFLNWNRNCGLPFKSMPTKTRFHTTQTTLLGYAVVWPTSIMSASGKVRVWPINTILAYLVPAPPFLSHSRRYAHLLVHFVTALLKSCTITKVTEIPGSIVGLLQPPSFSSFLFCRASPDPYLSCQAVRCNAYLNFCNSHVWRPWPWHLWPWPSLHHWFAVCHIPHFCRWPSPGSVLSFAVVDKTHLLCNKCNKKIVGYYNYRWPKTSTVIFSRKISHFRFPDNEKTSAAP